MSATCKQCIDLLVDYVDGALESTLHDRLHEHLDGCGACEEFLATYRATTTLCKQALAREMPQSLANKLRAFLQQQLASAKPESENH